MMSDGRRRDEVLNLKKLQIKLKRRGSADQTDGRSIKRKIVVKSHFNLTGHRERTTMITWLG